MTNTKQILITNAILKVCPEFIKLFYSVDIEEIISLIYSEIYGWDYLYIGTKDNKSVLFRVSYIRINDEPLHKAMKVELGDDVLFFVAYEHEKVYSPDFNKQYSFADNMPLR